MRTTVQPTPDPDITDEYPACTGSVNEDGVLVIVADEDQIVTEEYGPTEWHTFTTYNFEDV